MKARRWRLAFLALPVAIWAAFTSAPSDIYGPPRSLPTLIEEVAAATFEIKCIDWVGTGWGVNLDGQSFIVTAQHVVEDCLNGEFIAAANSQQPLFALELVAADGSYWDSGQRDLALLRSSREIPTLVFQAEPIKVGQWVMSAGYPLYGRHLVNFTQGQISGLDGDGMVATDAVIARGHSGGPLVNSRGEVVATIFAGDDGLGFGQPLLHHCWIILTCLDGLEPRYSIPN